MKLLYACVAACLIGAAITPEANAGFKTGNDLFQECQIRPDDFSYRSGIDFGMCMGYVLGVADKLRVPAQPFMKLHGTTIQLSRVCLRDDITAGQLRDVVVKWLDDNPAYRDLNADGLIGIALSQAFPC